MLTERRPLLDIPEVYAHLTRHVEAQMERVPLALSDALLLDVSNNSFILASSHHGYEYVAKLPRPGVTVSPAGERKRDYLNLQANLTSYIPQTSFVQIPPHNERQPESSLVIQKRIFGTTLSEITWEELRAHPKIVSKLKDLTLRSMLMFQNSLMLPDLFGMYPPPHRLRRVLIKNSQNLMVDTSHEGVFLVDTDCHPEFFSVTHAALNQKIKIGARLAGMGYFIFSL